MIVLRISCDTVKCLPSLPCISKTSRSSLVTGDMEYPSSDRIISGDWATFSCQLCQSKERPLPHLCEDRVGRSVHYQPNEAEAAQLLESNFSTWLPLTVLTMPTAKSAW